MAINSEGKLAMTQVILKPVVEFDSEAKPTPEQLTDLHHGAHERCFIANSVLTDVKVELT